jgi:hypothetical protein
VDPPNTGGGKRFALTLPRTVFIIQGVFFSSALVKDSQREGGDMSPEEMREKARNLMLRRFH